MALIDEGTRDTIRRMFQELRDSVRIVYFTRRRSSLVLPGQDSPPQDDCPYCEETQALLEEVAALSDTVTLEVHNFVAEGNLARSYGVDKIPATVLVGARDYGWRFFGIPAGNEFRNLIEGIVEVSKGSATLSPRSLERLAQVTQPVHIQVFVTPT